MAQVIVVGGGLAGLSAAHTVLQGGNRVVLIDKAAFLGGNSTKATSGINGSGTKTQAALGIDDNKDIFFEDTIRGATGVKTGPCPPPYELGRVLTYNSADAVHWIQQNFGLALDKVSRLGGHSNPRTHRSGEGGKFPGMEITYALMEKLDTIAQNDPATARVITRARVDKLITDSKGAVIGVEYDKGGVRGKELGAVIIASGGYGAGSLFKESVLARVRPDLIKLPTTNGIYCTGDGIDLATSVGGGTIDLKQVQVHPTGLVHPEDPENPVKFLAAEALRGEGGIILDREGKRFCNDVGTRDYVTGCMWKQDKAPYRLVLNGKASKNIEWHCKHYTGRGVMKHYTSGAALAKDMGLPTDALQKEFVTYNGYAKNNNDPWGKKYFDATPYDVNDTFYVAVITPVVHYTMGGLLINGDAHVLREDNKQPVAGLFAAGEVTGGVHGNNRLGGSALLECVVYGRQAGNSVNKYVASLPAAAPATGSVVTISIPQPNGTSITVTVSGSGAVSTSASTATATAAVPAAVPAAAPAEKKELKEYTLAEVAKHKSEKDCWVAVNGEVLDVTSFLDDHPGGKMAIMTFAGKDATEEFNMLHDKGVVAKFAPNTIIGTLKATAKL